MKAELVPENGDPPIPILKDITVVGRREFCDVVVDDASLSKRHCVLVKTDGLLIVRDLASTNGTKVKGQRVRWAALLPEDRLSFGVYKVRVYLGPDHAPSPSELRVRHDRKADLEQTPIAAERPRAPGAPPEPAPPPPPAPAPPVPPPQRASAWNPGDDRTKFASPSPLEVPIVSSAVSDREDEQTNRAWQGLLGGQHGEDIRVDLD